MGCNKVWICVKSMSCCTCQVLFVERSSLVFQTAWLGDLDDVQQILGRRIAIDSIGVWASNKVRLCVKSVSCCACQVLFVCRSSPVFCPPPDSVARRIWRCATNAWASNNGRTRLAYEDVLKSGLRNYGVLFCLPRLLHRKVLG